MWANFLIGITGPVVTKVLTTLGLGIVTYTGITSLLEFAHQQIQQSFNSLPADVSQLFFLSGVPESMAIILSAIAARAGMSQLSKIQRL